MRLRIHQKHAGDLYTYYVTIKYKSFDCMVDRHAKTDNMPATISSDLKTITFNGNGFWINGLHNDKPKHVKYLKVPKARLRDVRDMVLDDLG